MTPAARLAAAIDILDLILAGQPVEPALTGWARANRFAGSGDRLAIRDHVFDALRARRSLAALGGGTDGRALILGLARANGWDVAALFSGQGHAPAPPGPQEAGRAAEGAEAHDVPDWLLPRLQGSLGEGWADELKALRLRAPVFVRVNTARCSRPEAIAALAGEGVEAVVSPLAATALEVTGNARRIQHSRSYGEGLIELQDASSQAVLENLALRPGLRVLDYCAGGGGKALAMAASPGVRVFAHDIARQRMRDLPERARRAGAQITLVEDPRRMAPFDLVLFDAPCSGSGSWRRDPMGKWSLTEDKLNHILKIQAQLLDLAPELVCDGGAVVYATCSLLVEENDQQIDAFLRRRPEMICEYRRQLRPSGGGDGFFVAGLRRPG